MTLFMVEMSFIAFFGSGDTPMSALFSDRQQVVPVERPGEGEVVAEAARATSALHLLERRSRSPRWRNARRPCPSSRIRWSAAATSRSIPSCWPITPT